MNRDIRGPSPAGAPAAIPPQRSRARAQRMITPVRILPGTIPLSILARTAMGSTTGSSTATTHIPPIRTAGIPITARYIPGRQPSIRHPQGRHPQDRHPQDRQHPPRGQATPQGMTRHMATDHTATDHTDTKAMTTPTRRR